jgi:F0F1-type ATP synthase assembly protein I
MTSSDLRELIAVVVGAVLGWLTRHFTPTKGK